MMYYYNGFMPGYMGWGWGPIGLIFNILLWALIAAIVIAVIRRVFHKRDWHVMDQSMNIIKERYAKGEITKEQFEQMKKDLQ
jgi:putative membrane protein